MMTKTPMMMWYVSFCLYWVVQILTADCCHNQVIFFTLKRSFNNGCLLVCYISVSFFTSMWGFFQPGDDFGAGSDSDEEEDESDDEEVSEDDEEDDSEDDGDMLPIEKASKKLDKKLKKAK